MKLKILLLFILIIGAFSVLRQPVQAQLCDENTPCPYSDQECGAASQVCSCSGDSICAAYSNGLNYCDNGSCPGGCGGSSSRYCQQKVMSCPDVCSGTTEYHVPWDYNTHQCSTYTSSWTAYGSCGTPPTATPTQPPPTCNAYTHWNNDCSNPSPNSCTNNGTETGTQYYSDCSSSSRTRSCSVINCSSGYTCDGTSCVAHNVSVTLSADPNSVDYNTPSYLTWTSQNATSCSGPESINPGGTMQGYNVSTGPLTTQKTYSITCYGTGGSASASVTVNVNPPPTPIATLTCADNTVSVQWRSTGAAGYTVQLATDPSRNSNGSFVTIKDSSHTSGTSATFTGQPNVQYYAVVKADGDSAYYPTPASATPNSVTCPPPAKYTVSGIVNEDTTGSSCASAYTASSIPVTLQNNDDTNIPSVQKNTDAGTFQFPPTLGGLYSVALTLPDHYSFESVTGSHVTRIGNNAQFLLSHSTGNITNITFCITKIQTWFQADNGDVRMGTISDALPTGKFLFDAPENPGIAISSSGTSDFGSGNRASATGWNINREYTHYNSLSSTSLGSASYSFYKSRLKQSGQNPLSINCQNYNNCAISFSASGVYEFPGDITVTSISIAANKHIILLVNGNLRLKTASKVIVPQGSLLVVAAKKDIIIDKSVGNTLDDATDTLDGYYTAEGNITLESKTPDCSTDTDLQLIVGGALISNSLRPLSNAGTNTVDYKARTLCSHNADTPVLKVKSRPDFLTQLTDFYKVTIRTWKEVNP